MMHGVDFLREKAKRLRHLAQRAPDPAIARELMELAAECEVFADVLKLVAIRREGVTIH